MRRSRRTRGDNGGHGRRRRDRDCRVRLREWVVLPVALGKPWDRDRNPDREQEQDEGGHPVPLAHDVAVRSGLGAAAVEEPQSDHPDGHHQDEKTEHRAPLVVEERPHVLGRRADPTPNDLGHPDADRPVEREDREDDDPAPLCAAVGEQSRRAEHLCDLHSHTA